MNGLIDTHFHKDPADKDKYIVLMRCAKYWYNRVPQLQGYKNLLLRNTNRCPALSRNNLRKSLPTQQDWNHFLDML